MKEDENGYLRGNPEHSDLISRQLAYTKIYLKNRHRYPLPFSEYVIHHKDRDKHNNSIQNLDIVTKEEHNEIHKLRFRDKKELDRHHANRDNKKLLEEYYKPIEKTSSENISKPKGKGNKKKKNKKVFWFIGAVVILLIIITFFILVKTHNSKTRLNKDEIAFMVSLYDGTVSQGEYSELKYNKIQNHIRLICEIHCNNQFTIQASTGRNVGSPLEINCLCSDSNCSDPNSCPVNGNYYEINPVTGEVLNKVSNLNN